LEKTIYSLLGAFSGKFDIRFWKFS